MEKTFQSSRTKNGAFSPEKAFSKRTNTTEKIIRSKLINYIKKNDPFYEFANMYGHSVLQLKKLKERISRMSNRKRVWDTESTEKHRVTRREGRP